MLFSDDSVADYINRHFEPAWVSVRPVPLVTIDFGNDNTITRTLHGNVATYACNDAGHVLDVLPGIYAAEEYLEQLRLLSGLHDSIQDAEDLETVLAEYHQAQIPIPKRCDGGGPSFAEPETRDVALQLDTQINQRLRRPVIHRHLAESGLVQPDDIKIWLYREVLHADLEDQWLGLGETLFANYPFTAEEQ